MQKQHLLAGFLVLSLTGCDTFNGLSGDNLNGRGVSMSGAGVIFGSPQDPITDAELATLIRSATPTTKAASDGSAAGPPAASPTDFIQQIGSFGNPLPSSPLPSDNQARQNAFRYSRNQIQGYVIAASNNRCNAFKLALRERSTNISFGLGSLATTLGTVGAIFTNGTSQILSGLSGATSGVNAEYNKDIMSNVTSSVIIPGIDKQRAAILQEIMNRRCYGIESYSLTQALADAVKYHAACSTDVGVAAASSALSQTHSQSLADAQTAIDAVKQMHETLYGKSDTASNGTKVAKAGGAATDAKSNEPPSTPASVPPKSVATSQQAASDPLLGASLNIQQCPSLSDKGLLPEDASTQNTAVGARGQTPTDKTPGEIAPASPSAHGAGKLPTTN